MGFIVNIPLGVGEQALVSSPSNCLWSFISRAFCRFQDLKVSWARYFSSSFSAILSFFTSFSSTFSFFRSSSSSCLFFSHLWYASLPTILRCSCLSNSSWAAFCLASRLPWGRGRISVKANLQPCCPSQAQSFTSIGTDKSTWWHHRYSTAITTSSCAPGTDLSLQYYINPACF